MKKLLATAALLAALTACRGGNDKGDITPVADSTVYEMGRSHAANMFATCNDSTSLRNYLLDTQAQIYDIEQKNGRQSASDYRHGFEDYVKFHDPALADEIL